MILTDNELLDQRDKLALVSHLRLQFCVVLIFHWWVYQELLRLAEDVVPQLLLQLDLQSLNPHLDAVPLVHALELDAFPLGRQEVLEGPLSLFFVSVAFFLLNRFALVLV